MTKPDDDLTSEMRKAALRSVEAGMDRVRKRMESATTDHERKDDAGNVVATWTTLTAEGRLHKRTLAYLRVIHRDISTMELMAC